MNIWLIFLSVVLRFLCRGTIYHPVFPEQTLYVLISDPDLLLFLLLDFHYVLEDRVYLRLLFGISKIEVTSTLEADAWHFMYPLWINLIIGVGIVHVQLRHWLMHQIVICRGCVMIMDGLIPDLNGAELSLACHWRETLLVRQWRNQWLWGRRGVLRGHYKV